MLRSSAYWMRLALVTNVAEHRLWRPWRAGWRDMAQLAWVRSE